MPLLAAVLAGGLLSGCGGDGAGTPPAGSGGSVSPSGSSAGSPAGSAKPPPDGSGGPPGGTPTVPPGELTITGQVTEGVEAGCLIMKSGGATYNLIGGDRAVLQSGGTLVVRGTPKPDLLSICQQGTPFQVIEARKA